VLPSAIFSSLFTSTRGRHQNFVLRGRPQISPPSAATINISSSRPQDFSNFLTPTTAPLNLRTFHRMVLNFSVLQDIQVFPRPLDGATRNSSLAVVLKISPPTPATIENNSSRPQDFPTLLTPTTAPSNLRTFHQMVLKISVLKIIQDFCRQQIDNRSGRMS